MTKIVCSALLSFLTVQLLVASDQEDVACDAVAKAFLQTRQTAHLSILKRMGRNTFREQVCQHNLRFPSGWIQDVVYETSDPTDLPESAQRLATWPDTGKTAARFGIGVCIRNSSSSGRPSYSVLIATYESQWTSFWRIFWE
jgi:hypothetical protein